MHGRMLRAGARLLFTNTAGAAPQVLDRYRMHDEAFAISYLAAEIACRAVRENASGENRARVVGNVRLPWWLPVHGYLTGAEVEAAAAAMVSAQIAGGVDAIHLSCAGHPAHVAAAFSGLRAGLAEAGRKVPVYANVREDVEDEPENPEEIRRRSISSAVLAHSLGASALAVSVDEGFGGASMRLAELARCFDAALFVPPGASEDAVRRCLLHPSIGPRLTFVGTTRPAEAWRLSRFVPAAAAAQWRVRNAANRNEAGARPNIARRGAAG